MIQLTKGTNVLDINLSDYSGAGQDVVQNGSFDDIGSDLILNGDFAEIGSDLVTNGDFSDVPLGSELVDYPNFTNSDISQWIENSGIADFTWNTAEFMNVKIDIANGNFMYAQFGQTLNASYNVTMRVRGTKADGVTAQGSAFDSIGDANNLGQVVSNPTLTSEWQDYEFNVWSTTTVFRLYLGSVLVGDLVDFDSISVKENINLVSNPNFTDTGADLVVDGDFPPTSTAWGLFNATLESGGVRIVNPLVGDNAYITQVISGSPLGKSFVLTYDVIATNGNLLAFEQATSINLDTSTTGTNRTLYFVWDRVSSDSLLIKRKPGNIVDITIDNVRLEELGADWTFLGVDATNTISIESGGARFNSVDANISLRQSILDVGKHYKLTCDITETIGQIALDVTTAGTTIPLNDGFNELYFTANSTTFSIKRYISVSNVLLNNITVQEVGQDWTLTSGASITALGAKITHTPTAGQISQASVLVLGKNYKFTYEITENISGGLKTNSAVITTMVTTVGTHTRYFEADDTTFIIARTSAVDNDVTITNISVQEVGQDWTVTNIDSTHYVEFFGGVGGARFVADTVDPIMTLTSQSPALLLGKSYKLIVDVTVVSGSVKFDAGGIQEIFDTTTSGTNNTRYIKPTSNVSFSLYRNSSNVDVTINSVIIQQLDTNNRWVTFADPASKAVLKLGQVDLEIDSSDNNCGVYQTGLIKPNKLYIITINMKATAALNVEIAASLGTTVSAVIGTTALTTSYKEYSFEYVTPFAVDHDLQIHRLFGSGANETISIDYVSMNGVDESKWINDPTWNPFATSLVFVPTLTDESTNNSKQFTLNTSITDGGWDGRSLHGQVIINEGATEFPDAGIINLRQPDFIEGFYQVEIRGYLGTFYRILGKGMAHLERASTEDGYNRFEAYNDSVTYKAYEE